MGQEDRSTHLTKRYKANAKTNGSILWKMIFGIFVAMVLPQFSPHLLKSAVPEGVAREKSREKSRDMCPSAIWFSRPPSRRSGPASHERQTPKRRGAAANAKDTVRLRFPQSTGSATNCELNTPVNCNSPSLRTRNTTVIIFHCCPHC